MKKIWLALIITICMSVSPLTVWAEDEWYNFLNTVDSNFNNSWNEIQTAAEQLKSSDDKAAFIESLKTCIDNEWNALASYQGQPIAEENSDYRFVQDTYIDGTQELSDALAMVTEEDLINPESEFWKKWKEGMLKRYDTVMELFYYLKDPNLDKDIMWKIHDKYYEDMILEDDSDSIQELQEKLGVDMDGSVGPGTLGALKQWQKDNGEEIRGIITRELIDKINCN